MSVWPATGMATHAHPVVPHLAGLFEHGTTSALIFSLQGGTVYRISGLIEPKKREGVWSGMRWDVSWLPDLWKNLSRTGSIELSPPPFGKLNNPSSSRNVLRGAFGVSTDEWLTLVQIGSGESCQGIVALTSKKSLQPALDTAKSRLKNIKTQASGAPLKAAA